jgi:hypothetical protein
VTGASVAAVRLLKRPIVKLDSVVVDYQWSVVEIASGGPGIISNSLVRIEKGDAREK